MSQSREIALLPRDGLFCKDGRGWYTSSSGRGHALGWPWPSTLRGALLTAWGRRQEELFGKLKTSKEWLGHKENGDVTLDASLALYRRHGASQWQQKHRVWPAPADALWLEDKENESARQNVHRLAPQPPKVKTLGRDDDPAREALWVPPPLESRGKPRKAPQWLGEEEFVNWLCGENITARADERLVMEKSLRVHVRINKSTMTAEEGMLFSHEVLEMRNRAGEWAIAARIGMKSGGELKRLATLGGAGFLSHIAGDLADDLFSPPGALLEAFGNGSSGLRLVVVSPARFEQGWLPDGFEAQGKEYAGSLPGVAGPVILRAAFVPRPLHVSGWDLAANNGKGAPKGTDRMVPPGAVYFFQKEGQGAFTRKEAEKLWLAALGGRQEEGFGRVVPGIWNVEG